MGLDVSNIKLKMIDGASYLEIKRFDRDIDGSRIHQEDFCQILSIRPSNNYQNEGGPSFKQIVNFIKLNLSNPSKDIVELAKIMIFNFLIGNCDYHGKNLSVIYKNDVKITPFYDLISTRIYPELSTDMAMSIDSIYNFDMVSNINIINELDSWGINGSKMLELILNDFKNIILNANKLKEEIKHEGIEIELIINLITNQFDKLNK